MYYTIIFSQRQIFLFVQPKTLEAPKTITNFQCKLQIHIALQCCIVLPPPRLIPSAQLSYLDHIQN